MKLIHCKKCHDVVRLIDTRWRMCECESCGGQYNADLLSATVGGDCDVIGIPNPFFDDVFKFLIEDNGGRQYYRDLFGWGKQDIWYGGGKGDLQIHKIKSCMGPRLEMKVEIVDETHTNSIITDKRDYLIDGERKPSIILENKMNPSFKSSKIKIPRKKKIRI